MKFISASLEYSRKILRFIFDWIVQILIGIDQTCNAILLGMADETLSSRAYRTEQKGRLFGRIFRPLIDFIMFFDTGHCRRAYLSEKAKVQLPLELRDN